MQEDSTLTASEDAPADQERLSQKFQRELNAGLVGLVLLAVLEQADEDLYGYQIAKRLQGEAAGNVPVKQGALYPALFVAYLGRLSPAFASGHVPLLLGAGGVAHQQPGGVAHQRGRRRDSRTGSCRGRRGSRRCEAARPSGPM